jgi:hypothetical protein
MDALLAPPLIRNSLEDGLAAGVRRLVHALRKIAKPVAYRSNVCAVLHTL